ncbi:flagellar filament capping protein FliD [Halarsenatibacter silvermanii]|uniref:Flagellar hook-associated protein 2 n=1 Tax=Halarsenatibacter silvermanii TaxID=321763 RepID=A0A1G9M1A3_9FIRM|nr:flagellar filament capping protein FliD [Halarsenatibacter silvermanii]SDL67903.1 Flagellar hook-associated protein 2 N-terminus [Halarsenatibacter silvermanii]
MVQGVSFDGMATGLETDEIINQLMEIERQSIVRQQQDIEEVESEREVWQQINQNLVDFDNTFSALDNEDIYQDREAISGDEEVMTVDAEPGAQPATYRDMRVEHRARANSFMADEAVWDVEDLDVEGTEEALGLDGDFQLSLAEDENTEVNINIEEEDSLADIRSSINQEAGDIAGARIVRGRLLIEAAETGDENAIAWEDTGDDEILETLTLSQDEHTEARDAEFQIEGMTETSATNENIELTDDVTIDLVGESAEEETFDIEVREDTAQFDETINEFVESYNEVQTHLSEMTDEEQPLQGDVTARRLQSSLRNAVMGAVEDIGEVNEEIFSLGEMGIEIDAASSETGDFDGLMSIADEGEFNQALDHHMDEVQNLFLGDEEAGVDGLIDRVNEQVETYVRERAHESGLIGDREDSLENEIGRIEDSIAREERRMESREERLRERFTRMETAVYEAQQQQQQVMSQIQQLGSASFSDMMM